VLRRARLRWLLALLACAALGLAPRLERWLALASLPHARLPAELRTGSARGGLLRGSHDTIVLLTLSPGGEVGYKGIRSRDTNGWPPNAKAMRAVYESSVRCYAWLHGYKLVIERNDQRARHRFVGGGELHGAARLKKSVCVNIYENVRPRKGLPVSQWCSNNTLLA